MDSVLTPPPSPPTKRTTQMTQSIKITTETQAPQAPQAETGKQVDTPPSTSSSRAPTPTNEQLSNESATPTKTSPSNSRSTTPTPDDQINSKSTTTMAAIPPSTTADTTLSSKPAQIPTRFKSKPKFSDVTIRAFGTDYTLHKILITKALFFYDLLLGRYESTSSLKNNNSLVVDDQGHSESLPPFYSELESEIDDYYSYRGSNTVDAKNRKLPTVRYTGDIDTVVTLGPNHYLINEIDENPNISKDSFELMLMRLYHHPDSQEELKIPNQMLITARFFGVRLIVENVVSKMLLGSDVLDPLVIVAFLADVNEVTGFRDFDIHHYTSSDSTKGAAEVDLDLKSVDKFLSSCFLVQSDYAIQSKLVEYCKCFLLKNGWQMKLEHWDQVPISITVGLIGQNYFFVPTEYDRALFILHLIERKHKLGQDEEVTLLRDVLHDELIYSNLTVDQLAQLQRFKDDSGLSYISNVSILNGLDTALLVANQIQAQGVDDAVVDYVPPNEYLPVYNYFTNPQFSKTARHSKESSVYSLSQLENPTKQQQHPHASSSPLPEIQKTSIPPFRIAYEFDRLGHLKNRTGLRSKIIFHCGSYWTLSLVKTCSKLDPHKYKLQICCVRRSGADEKRHDDGKVNKDDADTEHKEEEGKLNVNVDGKDDKKVDDVGGAHVHAHKGKELHKVQGWNVDRTVIAGYDAGFVAYDRCVWSDSDANTNTKPPANTKPTPDDPSQKSTTSSKERYNLTPVCKYKDPRHKVQDFLNVYSIDGTQIRLLSSLCLNHLENKYQDGLIWLDFLTNKELIELGDGDGSLKLCFVFGVV
ncbi:unnamed protein product [Ambrosiozyma monospora]|uniref:Unnamed protein product n=1 Tax=Ambrosiozyma monospora TaxID=43982 RepID=A0ACB5SWS7_AMBMO|nr:unnamed protein product [Ambrosiozyma monospora]